MQLPFDQYNADESTEMKPLSNAPELEKRGITSIQELHATGKAKDELVKRLLESFPDLYKEQGMGNREAVVLTVIELQTSRHADKYV